MTRSSGSSSSGASAARIEVCDERSSSHESGQTSMPPVRADQHVAGDQRRVLRQPPERLVDLGHDERLDAGRSLVGRGVALDQLGDAALVPRDGEQDRDGQAAPLDVAVERLEEPLPLLRHERVDQDGGLRRLVVDTADLSLPVVAVLPVGMRRRPAPETRDDLGDVHATTASGAILPSSIVQPASESEPSERIRYGLPCQRPMFSTSVREGRGGDERCEWKTASS